MPKTSDRRRKPRTPADAVAHSIAHRIRVDVLTLLHEGPASQKELATALQEPLSNITHHVNELAESGAIEIAFTRKVGNVDQNYWRPIQTRVAWADDLAELTVEEHEEFSRIIVQSILAELLAALRAGNLAGDPYASTAWDRAWLDQQGYRELSDAAGAYLIRMNEIAAESAARVVQSGETPKLYIGAVMAFKRARTEPNTTVTVGHLPGRGAWSGKGGLSGEDCPFEKSV